MYQLLLPLISLKYTVMNFDLVAKVIAFHSYKGGTGKTTLLHLLGGLLQPTAGNITINNQDILQLTAAKLDAFRGQSIGMISAPRSKRL